MVHPLCPQDGLRVSIRYLCLACRKPTGGLGQANLVLSSHHCITTIPGLNWQVPNIAKIQLAKQSSRPVGPLVGDWLQVAVPGGGVGNDLLRAKVLYTWTTATNTTFSQQTIYWQIPRYLCFCCRLTFGQSGCLASHFNVTVTYVSLECFYPLVYD